MIPYGSTRDNSQIVQIGPGGGSKRVDIQDAGPEKIDEHLGVVFRSKNRTQQTNQKRGFYVA